MDLKLCNDFIHGPPSAKEEKGAGVGFTEKGRNSVLPTGRVIECAGVPLGLGSRAPNRGTLVQLAVGNFQPLKPGLDCCGLKVFP